jgi:hypothetical protein
MPWRERKMINFIGRNSNVSSLVVIVTFTLGNYPVFVNLFFLKPFLNKLLMLKLSFVSFIGDGGVLVYAVIFFMTFLVSFNWEGKKR